jgi:hypothetical protein
MKFDALNNLNLSLLLDEITADITVRPFDTTVSLVLGNLSLEDDLRPMAQKYIVWSWIIDEQRIRGRDDEEAAGEEGVKDNPLSAGGDNKRHADPIHVNVICVLSHLSPLCSDNAVNVNIALSVISIAADMKSILHLRPFLDAFLAYTRSSQRYPIPSYDISSFPHVISPLRLIQRAVRRVFG